MKPIYGYWLIVIAWMFQWVSQILFADTQGRGVMWQNVSFFVSTLVYVGLGLVALYIAWAGQLQMRHRVILRLTGLAMLLAGGIGLFTSFTPKWWVQWPGLQLMLLALGTALEAVWILSAIVLGLARTTDMIKRILVLCLPVLRFIQVFGDLSSSNLALLLVLVIALAVLSGSFRHLAYGAWRV